ncbi:MAG TPA: copper resistance CopC family protein [Steroidobacteraceae bacterium]|nr:copper resistance CopC family protein [Steroidobacteraceae bacterium]
MTKGSWLAAGALCLASIAAWPHAHLTGSEPPEGSTGKPPVQIVLSFSESARLTMLTLQRDGAQPQQLALPGAVGARLAIAMPPLPAGRYTLEWRALGSDGHVTSGALHFAVAPAPQGRL